MGLATRRPVVGGPATALAVLFWKTFRASVTTGNEANTALLEGLKTLKLPDTAAEIPHQELKDVPSVVTAAPRAAPTICGSAEATEPDQHPPQFDHRAKTSIRKRIELDERYQPVCVAATVSGFSESSWGADYNRTVWGANSSGMTPVHQTNEVRLKS